MKVLTKEDIKSFSIKMLEETAKKSTKRFVVGWISSSYLESNIGKLSYIQICEHKIFTRKDFGRWQERIEIRPDGSIFYLDKEKNEFRNIKDVIEDIKNDDFSVLFCVKIIKKLEERTYLVKLFDKYFKIKTNYTFKYELNPKYYTHEWIRVIDKYNTDISEIALLGEKDILVELA